MVSEEDRYYNIQFLYAAGCSIKDAVKSSLKIDLPTQLLLVKLRFGDRFFQRKSSVPDKLAGLSTSFDLAWRFKESEVQKFRLYENKVQVTQKELERWPEYLVAELPTVTDN